MSYSQNIPNSSKQAVMEESPEIKQREDHKAKTVYIAGPMTGLPNWNYDAFNEKARDLRLKGYLVNNPAEIHNAQEHSREWCMTRAISLLIHADYIYLLKGWQNSSGAKLEKEIAEQCGIEVLYEARSWENSLI